MEIEFASQGAPLAQYAEGHCEALLGLSAAQLASPTENLFHHLHPADAHTLRRWFGNGAIPGEHGNAHLRVRHADGRYRIFHVYGARYPLVSRAVPALIFREPARLTVLLSSLRSPLIAVLLETTDDFIFFKDTHHRFLAASRSMVDLCEPGIRRSDFEGKSDYEMFSEGPADRYYELEQRVYAGSESAREVQPFVRPDGSQGWVDNRKYPIKDSQGALLGLYGVARDITAEIERTRSRAIASSLFETTSEGIVVLDEAGRIIEANAAFAQASGYEIHQVIGEPIARMRHSSDGDEDFAGRWQVLVTEGHWEGEVLGTSPSGAWRAESARFNAVLDEAGNAKYYIGVYTDITRLKQHELELEQAANSDILTGLPNRRLLEDRIRQSLALAQRIGTQVAVCYIDLDGFKAVNDGFGHAAGDELLIEYARRTQETLRDGDTLARLGGDEFVALLCGVDDELGARITMHRLLESGRKSFTISGEQVELSVSIGAALGPRDGSDPDELLRKADQAMYRAKLEGKDALVLFDELKTPTGATAHRLHEEFSAAIRRGELTLHYQPRIDVRTARVAGVEALVRWQHPDRGLLYPSEFLPVISRTALEQELDHWVLRSAVVQYQRWLEAGLEIPVSLNLTPATLQSSELAELLQEILDPLPQGAASGLQLEVLETGAIRDMGRVSAVMEKCLKYGVSFALDDFGTGYSSLTYYHRLPIATLKIDRAFVQNMLCSETDQAIVEGVLRLSQSLDRPVIAEGVEDVELGIMLLQLGCQYLQGYGIARPMPPEALSGWLTAWAEEQTWHGIVRHRRGPTPFYDLNVAIISHELWMERARQVIASPGTTRPDLKTVDACGFSRWFAGIGMARFGSRETFEELHRLHEEIHHCFDELTSDKQTGDTTVRRVWVASMESYSRSLESLLRSLAVS